MRPPLEGYGWEKISEQLTSKFGYSEADLEKYTALDGDKEGLMKLYKDMQLARGFENACNQQYMQGKVRVKSTYPPMFFYSIEIQGDCFNHSVISSDLISFSC